MMETLKHWWNTFLGWFARGEYAVTNGTVMPPQPWPAPPALPNRDAQHIETRKFKREEIAGTFRVPQRIAAKASHAIEEIRRELCPQTHRELVVYRSEFGGEHHSIVHAGQQNEAGEWVHLSHEEAEAAHGAAKQEFVDALARLHKFADARGYTKLKCSGCELSFFHLDASAQRCSKCPVPQEITGEPV